MKFSSKIAGFVIACALSTVAFPAAASAQQLNIEVEAVTNPWIANNSHYCTGSNANCTPKQFYKRPVTSPTATPKPEKKSITTPSYQTPTTQTATQQATTIPESPEYKKELDASILFGLVNEYRIQNNLAPFQEDARICSIAQDRAPQLYNEILGNSWMHKGFQELTLSYWATENIIYEFTEQKALNWWKNSPIHNSALLGNYQYSCIKCQGNTCAEIFTNFQEKVQTASIAK